MTKNDVGQAAREPVQPGREPGNAPEGEPGNAWVTPEAERPPRRQEGAVEPPARQADSQRTQGAGTVSNPDDR